MRRAMLLALLLSAAGAPAAGQFRVLTLGEGYRPWEGGGRGTAPVILARGGYRARLDSGNAPSGDIEFEDRPGWISPSHFDGRTNIASQALVWGKVRAPNSMNITPRVLAVWLEGMVNGNHDIAYERKPSVYQPNMLAFGIWLTVDFGRPVGVEAVRFYPRNTVVATPSEPYQGDYLRGYELWVNERVADRQGGSPDVLVARVPDNSDPVVTVPVPPQYARFVKLRSITEIPFEVDELEVYGTGYLPEATYYSDLLDLGDRATIGPINWVEEVVGEPSFSGVKVRVRTGSDDTPILFRRRLESGPFGAPPASSSVEVSPEDYYELESFQRLPPADDAAHWSPWRPVDNGGLISAPNPRRFVQFRIHLSGRLSDARLMDRLSFGYLTPPIADTLMGEVYPRLTEPEQPATFRYAVLLKGDADVLGFDELEVDTTIPVSRVYGLTIDGHPREFDLVFSREDAFRLAFPMVTGDGSVLEFSFDLPVFRFGTTFSGRAYNSHFPSVPQRLDPGQVVDFAPDDQAATSGLAVAIPEARIGTLVGSITLSTPVVTPNGDGVNDGLLVQYNVLQLLAPAPVALDIYDLSGHRLGGAGKAAQSIGEAQLRWDGCDDGGRPVPPGVYIWMLRVMADAFEERHAGTVAVAY